MSPRNWHLPLGKSSDHGTSVRIFGKKRRTGMCGPIDWFVKPSRSYLRSRMQNLIYLTLERSRIADWSSTSRRCTPTLIKQMKLVGKDLKWRYPGGSSVGSPYLFCLSENYRFGCFFSQDLRTQLSHERRQFSKFRSRRISGFKNLEQRLIAL